MPEMLFDVMWPDDSLDRCYSPSTVIQKHVRTDTSYALEELLENLRAGLTEAGERISQRFGHYCSGARDQLARLEAKSARFAPQEQVRILGLYRRGGARPLEAVLADEQQRRQSLLEAELPLAAE